MRIERKLGMRRLAGLVLLAGLCAGWAAPVRSQQVSVAQHQRDSDRDARKQAKLQRKAAKRQAKAQKRLNKAQAKQLKKARKADAKANRQLARR
jgi:hypothetical protein